MAEQRPKTIAHGEAPVAFVRLDAALSFTETALDGDAPAFATPAGVLVRLLAWVVTLAGSVIFRQPAVDPMSRTAACPEADTCSNCRCDAAYLAVASWTGGAG